MSLYGGIKFASAQNSAGPSERKPDPDETPASTSSAPIPGEPKSATKSAAPWSAALKFAPRIKQPKSTPSRPTASSTTTYSAAPVLVEKAPELRQGHAAGPGVTEAGDLDAVEVLGPDGKVLARAPAMTLTRGGGKWASKAGNGGEKTGGGAEKRKKKKKASLQRDVFRDQAFPIIIVMCCSAALCRFAPSAIEIGAKHRCILHHASFRYIANTLQKKQNQTLPLFDPEEQYDPNKPNDLGEYQAYRKRLREERRQRLIEEKRRQLAGEESSSYYTDSEEEAPRRDAPKMFAPPRLYSPPTSSRAPAPTPSDPPPSVPPPAQAPSATGEDAYARRLAMSQAATGDDAYARRAALSQAATGDDAFARRAALSNPPLQMSAPLPGPGMPPHRPDFAPPPGIGSPRRPPLFATPAPSSSRPDPPLPSFVPSEGPGRPPAFVPPPMHAFSAAPPPPLPSIRPPTATVLRAPPVFPPSPPPPAEQSDIPGFGAFSAPSRPPAPFPAPQGPVVMPAPATEQAGPSAAPSEDTAPAPPGPPVDFQAMLDERMKAAAAIAAKYQHLSATPVVSAPESAVPPPPSDAPPLAPDEANGTFAEKMMRRWGHVEGTLLGKSGSGIVHALSAEHFAPPPKPADPNQPLSKRQLAKQKAAAANLKNRKWVQHANARGRIVNANEDERAAEERSRVGEASRVVLLGGMVEGVEDVDEELADEIGEECSKYGIVERVVLHMVEPPPPDPADCLRVFVVFSGMAGAWRSIKELDGRFFGGKKITAKYFDEKKFDAGDRDGEM